MSMRPLLAGHAPAATIAIDGRRRVSVDAFVASTHALAAALPPAACALLLCEDRVRFALGLSALMLRGTTALLPPSHAPRVLAGIATARGAAYALVDPPASVEGIREIVVEWPGPGEARAVPSIDEGHVAVVAYTSGTTGEPQPHAKTWGSLVRGAGSLRERVAFAAGETIVGAVPPQHMWGLEATVLLAMQGGGAMHAATPLLPLDIAAKLAEASAPRRLVLTPVHARACVLGHASLPPIAGSLCATAPLDTDAAAAFERLSAAPLMEIYGSSETGGIATRRPVRDATFAPFHGIRVESLPVGIAVEGGHVAGRVEVRDRVEVQADGSFLLLGRDADLVKVGGKRASLAMLNITLRSIPGVVDAEYVLIERGGLSPRLAALVVAPALDRDAVLAALRERIDAVFLPRPLHLVDALPRNAVGKAAKVELLRRFELAQARDAARGAS